MTDKLYTVRLFRDSYDHEGYDVSAPMPRDKAEALCRTQNESLEVAMEGIPCGFGGPGYYDIRPFVLDGATQA